MAEGNEGFTLLELMVVVLIVGILAALSIPQYNKTTESARADDAVSVAQMIGTTNRMYSLDFQGVMANGPITNACNAAACAAPGPPGGSPDAGCNLVGCNYLAAQAWDSKFYDLWALSPPAAGNNACPAGTFPANRYVACAVRKAGGPTKSNCWGYAVTQGGQVIATTASCGWTVPPPPT